MILTPMTLVIDTREQAPYDFSDVIDSVTSAPVRTTRATLRTGDYSIVGEEEAFGCERKSIADLFSTVIGNRPRFVRELERAASRADRFFIIVEGSIRDVLSFTSPEARGISDAARASRPRAVINSLASWEIEHGVRVIYADRDRDVCRALVWRLAERFWRAKHDPEKKAAATTVTKVVGA